jgi:hypothetical protein
LPQNFQEHISSLLKSGAVLPTKIAAAWAAPAVIKLRLRLKAPHRVRQRCTAGATSNVSGNWTGSTVTMQRFVFNPPLTLKGNIVVRNLDDAVRFMTDYRKTRRPVLLKSILHRLEGAVGEAEERDAAYAFRGWAEIEKLVVHLPDSQQ